jgi:hypothetical protein
LLSVLEKDRDSSSEDDSYSLNIESKHSSIDLERDVPSTQTAETQDESRDANTSLSESKDIINHFGKLWEN